MADSGKRNAFSKISMFKIKRPVSSEGNGLSPSREEPEICERLKAEEFIVSKTYRYGFPEKPTCIAYDPVQSILAIGTNDGSLKILGKLGVECHVKHETNAPVQCLIFLVNEGALIAICPNDVVNLWNLRQAQPVIVQSLKFRREVITAVHLPFQSKWLYIGTEKGNVHIVNVEKFEVSGYIIYWNKCVEIRCKTHPGTVVHLSDNPVDQNKLLIGYDTGLVVIWSLRDKIAEQRCYCPQESLTCAYWLNDGKQFMCGHTDGSLSVWAIKNVGKPLEKITPHAKSAKERGCGPIYKLNWLGTSSGEPLVVFCGGSPSGKKRRGLTLKQGRHTKTLYSETVIDFVCVASTPWAADCQDPKAVIAITPDKLLAYDLVVSLTKVPMFPIPYTFDIHDAAVTSMEYVADCPPDLIKDLLTVGEGAKKKPLRREDSRQTWPVNGGVRSSSSEESSLSLIITGHSDGTVKFWEASSAVMSCLLKVSTSKLFEKDKTKSSCSESSDASVENSREQPSTADVPADEQDLYAVQQVKFCVHSRILLVCGNVHVLLFQFSLIEQTLELTQLDFNLTFEKSNNYTTNSPEDSDSSPTEVNDSFPTPQPVPFTPVSCKTGVYKRQPGFQPELCCVTGPSPDTRPINVVAHSSQFGMLSVSNGLALALVDTIQKKLVTLLSAQDVHGLVTSPFSQPVCTPLTPGTPVSFVIHETGVPVDVTLDIESGDKTKKQKPPRPPPPARAISKKGSNESDDGSDGIFRNRTTSTSNQDSAPDAVQCVKFALTFTKKNDNLMFPCLWVGTVLGSVFVVAINLPPGESRLIQPVLTMVTGTVFPLKCGMILSVSILNKEGHLLPSPFQFWKELQAKNYKSVISKESTERHFAVICAEKEARVYQLPPSSQSSHHLKHKANLMEDSAVVLRADVVLIQGSSCLLCLNVLGKLLAFSLPSLTSLMKTECSFLLTDYRFLRTLTFSDNGQAAILCSSSEVQRFSCYNKISTNTEVTESTSTFFKAMDVPECNSNKPSFFGTLFSSSPSPLDREQLFGPESGKASCSVAEYVPGPGMEKLQETSSELASAMQKNKMALMERGRKLERLDETTTQMASQAKTFSEVSRQVMIKYKDKKWYQV